MSNERKRNGDADNWALENVRNEEACARPEAGGDLRSDGVRGQETLAQREGEDVRGRETRAQREAEGVQGRETLAQGEAEDVRGLESRAEFWREREGGLSKKGISVRGLVTLVLVVWGAFWFLKNDADADLWGHIRYGEDLLRSGVLPEKDPYSYTAGETKWINHEILAEVAFALLARQGHWALQGTKLAIGLICLAFVIGCSRNQRISALLWLVLFSSGLTACVWGWATRPQLFSFLFFAMLLWLLDVAQKRPWALWGMIPVLSIWTNCHGGFLFGLGCFGFALLADLVREIHRNGLRNRGRILQLVGLGIAGLASTLINPYGFGLYSGLVHELSIARPQIGEWLPVSWTNKKFLAANLLLIYAALSMLLSRKPMRIDQRVILLACMIETQMHVRHVVFLGLACIAWLPEHFEGTVRRVLGAIGLFAEEAREDKPICLPFRPVAVVASLVAVIGTFLVCVQENGFFATVRDRLTKVHVRRDEFPTEAVRYMEERKFAGRIVVPFNWGQYILDAFYPSLLVSFDGRYGTVYSREVLDLNFDLWYPEDPRIRFRAATSPPFDPAAILNYGEPDLVLLDYRGYPQSAAVLEKHAEWVLLYEDGQSRLYGRKTRYDEVNSKDYVPNDKRKTVREMPSGRVDFPAHRREVLEKGA